MTDPLDLYRAAFSVVRRRTDGQPDRVALLLAIKVYYAKGAARGKAKAKLAAILAALVTELRARRTLRDTWPWARIGAACEIRHEWGPGGRCRTCGALEPLSATERYWWEVLLRQPSASVDRPHIPAKVDPGGDEPCALFGRGRVGSRPIDHVSARTFDCEDECTMNAWANWTPPGRPNGLPSVRARD